MDPPPVEHLFLITGTTRGIGKALVTEALKRPGSFTVSLSRAKPFLWRNRQNILIDLSQTGAIEAALQAVHFDFTAADGLKNTVLINNAGVLDPIAPIGGCDADLLDRSIRVNLTAPLVLSRHFYRFSKSFNGRKWIVNITSGASQNPYYGWAAYGAAKAGLDMATRAMALEFDRIDPAFRACAVAPGTVDTDMQTRIRQCTPEQFARVAKFHDLKANGDLYPPQRTAAALIRFILDGTFENGGRYDLREMGV
jgi:benzil reductase ((S)-benzoin forming)